MRGSTRKPGVIRRHEIADAALAVLGQGGLSALTTAAIASRLDLTPAALFRHFASLEEILHAAIGLGAQRLEESLPDATLPPARRLEVLIRGRVELLLSEPGIAWLLRSNAARLHLPPEAMEEVRSKVRRTREFLLTALSEGAAAGDVRPDASPQALLTIVTGTIQSIVGSCGARRGEGEAPDPQELIAALLRVIGSAAPSPDAARSREGERNGDAALG